MLQSSLRSFIHKLFCLISIKTYKRVYLMLFVLLCIDTQAVDQWEQMPNFPAIGRHRAMALSIEGKGYMGLGHINSVVNIALADFWEYDPATSSWTQKADFGGGNRYHPLVFSVGGKGYVGCGRSESSQFNDMWSYDPVTNTWTQLNDYPEGPRLGPLAFVINDVAYCGTGVGSGNDRAFYRYDHINDNYIRIADFPGSGRATGVAFALDGKGYVGTGSASFSTGNDFWEYKPSEDQWVARASVPGPARQGATGFAVNHRGYILTGNNWADNFKDVWEFNPGSNSWKQMPNFPGTPRRFMHSFVIGDVAYCGSGTTGINLNDFWKFDPLGETESKSLKSAVQVYPNPSSDFIFFELDEVTSQNEYELIILDMNGRLLSKQNFDGNNIRLDKNTWRNGTYCFMVYKADQLMDSGKFIFH